MEKLSVTKCKVCGEKLIVPSDKSFFHTRCPKCDTINTIYLTTKDGVPLTDKNSLKGDTKDKSFWIVSKLAPLSINFWHNFLSLFSSSFSDKRPLLPFFDGTKSVFSTDLLRLIKKNS